MQCVGAYFVFPHGTLAMTSISLQDINAHQSVVNIAGGNQTTVNNIQHVYPPGQCTS
jgi:hypothetical protein